LRHFTIFLANTPDIEVKNPMPRRAQSRNDLGWSRPTTLKKHWSGAKLVDAQTMLEWAKSMTCTGVRLVVELSPHRGRKSNYLYSAAP
jgi:hypothetical protein